MYNNKSNASTKPPIMHVQPYNDFGNWIRHRFPYRVQKISIDGGFSCPNRDGKISIGGCSFCDNRTFSPSYCNSRKSITQQLEEGKAFFARKYPDMKYLAYFQAFSGTYASIETLKHRYEEALSIQDVVGIVIGTRPDCIPDPVLNYLQELNQHHFIMVEFGIESTNDVILKHINRGHDFTCSREAISKTHERGIMTGGHIIIGLPGEETSDIVQQAKIISATDLDVLKIHQLQIIRGTRLAYEYAQKPFHLYTVEEYIDVLVNYIGHLRPTLILERFVSQSPAEMLVAPKWGLKNHEFTAKLVKRMQELNVRQGTMR